VAEVGESGGGLGLDEALGSGGEERGEGEAEVAGGEDVVAEEFTDLAARRKDLFVEKMGEIINVSRPHQQMGFDFHRMFLERVETDPKGTMKFFPFVGKPSANEPKTIEINLFVGFGKPVITGTGISTAIIAARFNARESVKELAEEYGCAPEQIEEAIRWERPIPLAA
jgi:uncharacterized protein (DUF433 family)